MPSSPLASQFKAFTDTSGDGYPGPPLEETTEADFNDANFATLQERQRTMGFRDRMVELENQADLSNLPGYKAFATVGYDKGRIKGELEAKVE